MFINGNRWTLAWIKPDGMTVQEIHSKLVIWMSIPIRAESSRKVEILTREMSLAHLPSRKQWPGIVCHVDLTISMTYNSSANIFHCIVITLQLCPFKLVTAPICIILMHQHEIYPINFRPYSPANLPCWPDIGLLLASISPMSAKRQVFATGTECSFGFFLGICF